MRRFSVKQPVIWIGLGAVALVIGMVLSAGNFASISASKSGGNDEQADSAKFTVHLKPDGGTQDMLYCGVGSGSEPFEFKVATANPPKYGEGEGPDPLAEPTNPSHEGAGWLETTLQSGQTTTFNVPYNDSYSFALTLGGRTGQDQMIQLSSPPKGDATGGGAPITGFASVKATKGATDPFDGDGRTDNYCVTVGYPEGSGSEYAEGQISTKLAVPDSWVTDGDGSNGGVLVVPH